MEQLNINTPVIRPFEPSDRAMVEEFFDQMGGETRAFFDRGSGNRKSAVKFFEGQDNNTIRWAAVINTEKDELMVGYVYLWDLDKKIPWLGIAVREEWKGHHLGRRLLEHARSYVESINGGGILLTTAQANMRGQGLYERCGYERLGNHSSGEVLYLLRF